MDVGTQVVGSSGRGIIVDMDDLPDDNGAEDPAHDMVRRRTPEEMAMPRRVDEIVQCADAFAQKFENYEPEPSDELDRDAVLTLRAAVTDRWQPAMGMP